MKKEPLGYVRLLCRFSLFLLLLFLPSAGCADGVWTTLTEEHMAEIWKVSETEYSGQVTITFLGDCTLGGEAKSRSSRLGFVQTVKAKGMDYPLSGIRKLTLEDDLSVANLETVLTDRTLKKADRQFNFSGPTAYTEILSSAGIECVTLANNHAHDYGDAGYADTKAALEHAGICWFGTEAPAVWRNGEGLMIGFAGVHYSLSGSRYTQYEKEMQLLRDMGCSAIVTVMHAGTEYSYTPPDSWQQQIVARAVQCGSCLIVGHHPHVVQGYDLIDGIPVVYSLGNCSFGGTTYAKDPDALVLQAVMTFYRGELIQTDLHFYPISFTGDGRNNHYAPQFLNGKDAERVLEKMRESTGRDPGSFDESEGAVVKVIYP